MLVVKSKWMELKKNKCIFIEISKKIAKCSLRINTIFHFYFALWFDTVGQNLLNKM